VHRAQDLLLGREVAVKRIRLEGAAEPGQLEEAKQRFLREARVAARLRHPNIVTTHDIVSSPQTSFIVMELVEGRTLQSLLADRGRLPLAEAVTLLAQVAAALDHAHANGVVHRDVKPANVMVEPSGQVKVMDFGIAKPETGANLTATGALLGTPSYMSPEQARGGKVDGRSDLFSLGCVLYECLTGVRPFGAESVTAILVRILTEEPPPVDFEATGLPRAVDEVLSRSLAKDPGRRFATGAEMIAALRRAGGLGEVTPPAASIERAAPAAAPPPPADAAPAGTPTVLSTRPAPVAAAPARAHALSPRTRALSVAALLALLAGGLAVLEIGTRPARRSALVVEEPVGLVGRLLGREPRLRVTVPEGTTLRVSLGTPLSSETAAAGDAVSGEVAGAVRIDGIEALPAHSTVTGHVTRAVSAGQGGRAELAFELDGVTLPEGPRYPLRTRPLTLRSGRAARDSFKAGLSEMGAAVEGLFGGKKPRPAAAPDAGREVTLAAHATVMVETAEPVAILRPRRP